MTVGIYIRTSTLDQNPENQLSACKNINQWGNFELYKDQQSAWKDNVERENFERLRKDIKKKLISHLIVWDLDRIYRNRKKLIEFFKFCKLYGCKIHSQRQQFFETLNTMPEPFNEALFDFMLQMMGWLAEDESNKRSERVKASTRKDKEGRTVSYKGNKWGRKPISKKVISEVYRLHKEGLSIRSIINEVEYWDKNNNRKRLGIGTVHKIISDFKE